MGKVHEHIDQRLSEWIMHQPMFFVGSAPSGDGGHINLSPKGPIGTFRVLDGHTVAYLDVVEAAPRRSRTCARTAAS